MAPRADIEGLRAVAVALVVAYHAGWWGAGGGFIGVDVFFVVSGFLITSLLLRERIDTGRVDLIGFWARRARRLLPIATTVIATVVVAGWVILPMTDRPRLGRDALASSLFSANWVFAERGTDYLAADTDPS
ncbi:MAG: acyltransferase, partial [Actinobacteria bacterium]|nr:acyltransferase [Actinomycetota bacterium]